MSDPKRPAWIFAAIAVGVLYLMAGADTPVGPKPSGPDLVPAFRQTDKPDQAREDARSLCAFCDALAATIEYDGARGDQARLTTGVQLDNLRRWSREYMLRGESLGTRYPKLPEEIGKYLDQAVGTAGGPIDADARKKWVQAHRDLARCAQWAADQL